MPSSSESSSSESSSSESLEKGPKPINTKPSGTDVSPSEDTSVDSPKDKPTRTYPIPFEGTDDGGTDDGGTGGGGTGGGGTGGGGTGGGSPIPIPGGPPILSPFLPLFWPQVVYDSYPRRHDGKSPDPISGVSGPEDQPENAPSASDEDEQNTCVAVPLLADTTTGGDSVDLAISFGHFPMMAGMPSGRILLYAHGLYSALADGSLFCFDHISQRRIGAVIPSTSNNPSGNSKVALITQTGCIRYYDFTNGPIGVPFGGTEIHPERLRMLNSDGTVCYGNVEDATFFEETFTDGSIIIYRADDGTPYSFRTVKGVVIHCNELGGDLRIVRHTPEGKCVFYDNKLDELVHANNIQNDRIRQIWCRTDGLLDCPNAQTINWYAPADTFSMTDENGLFLIRKGATPMKTWNLSSIAEESDDASTQPAKLSQFKMRAYGSNSNESSRWMPYGIDGTYFIKGTGDQAICSVKIRRPLTVDSQPIERPNGTVLKAENKPVAALEEIKYTFKGERSLDGVNIEKADFVESSIRNEYRSYPFGDVLVKQTHYYGSAYEETSTFIYETNASSLNYGRMIRKTTPEGNWTNYDYDAEGRVIRERTLWDDAVSIRETRTTYVDEWYNDHRPSCIEEWIITPQGNEVLLKQIICKMEESSNLLRETITQTAVGVEYPRITITEINGSAADCSYARGRTKKIISPDGSETVYDYLPTTELGAVWMEIATKTVNGHIAPGKSTRTILFINERGDEFFIREQVHDGSDFITISERNITTEETSKPVLVQKSDGTQSSTEWNCSGPVHETHDNGMQSWYEYDTLKRLVRETHEAPVPLKEIQEYVAITRQPDTIITHEYDGLNREIATVVSIGSNSSRTERSFDCRGYLVISKDVSGLVTRYEYSHDRLKTTTFHPGGKVSIIKKNIVGFVVEKSESGTRSHFYQRQLTANGIMETIRLDSPDGPVVQESLLDGFNRTIHTGYPSGDHSNGLVYEYIQYDEHDHIISRRQEGMPTTLTQYDNFGRISKIIVKHSESNDIDPYTDFVTEHEIVYTKSPDIPIEIPEIYNHGVFEKNSIKKILPGGYQTTEESYTLISRNDTFDVSLRKNKYGRWEVNTTMYKQGNAITTNWQEGISNASRQYSISGDVVLSIYPNGQIISWKRQYNIHGSSVSQMDERGNTLVSCYDNAGRLVSKQDGEGHTTSYTYDPDTGYLICITDPMKGTIHYRYNEAGQITEQYGTGTQPIRKEYDTSGHLVSLTTWRNAGKTLLELPSFTGDTTRWEYDTITGLQTKKTYADGTSQTKVYDRFRRTNRIIHPDGSFESYTYHSITGKVTEISFSDQSPSIYNEYDDLGRPISVMDSTGTRTFIYNNLGDLIGEQFRGTLISVLDYKLDDYGRDVGYTLTVNGKIVQDTSMTYDEYGRLKTASPETGKTFTYDYGADNLLIRIIWPNGMIKELQYEPNRNIVSSLIYRGVGGQEILGHRYTYDALGRATLITDHDKVVGERITVPHYNMRNELTAVTYDGREDYNYSYDNIGNRVKSRELAKNNEYSCNELNQYVSIQTLGAGKKFIPEFDSHGNQTLIQTNTGIWEVHYNVDNRPVLFENGKHSVVCSYDFMGRRTDRLEYHENTLTSHEHFIYKGYVQIAAYKLDAEQSEDCFMATKSYYWDPAQPTATRILAVKDAKDATRLYAACDMMKNITALYDDLGVCRARYIYSPYGEKLMQYGDKCSVNNFGFSSEYDDTSLGLYYYNYRYFNKNDGRWISRDPGLDANENNDYVSFRNNPSFIIDSLGLRTKSDFLEMLSFFKKEVTKKLIEEMILSVRDSSAKIEDKKGLEIEVLKYEYGGVVYKLLKNNMHTNVYSYTFHRALDKGKRSYTRLDPIRPPEGKCEVLIWHSHKMKVILGHEGEMQSKGYTFKLMGDSGFGSLSEADLRIGLAKLPNNKGIQMSNPHRVPMSTVLVKNTALEYPVNYIRNKEKESNKILENALIDSISRNLSEESFEIITISRLNEDINDRRLGVYYDFKRGDNQHANIYNAKDENRVR